MKLKKVGVIVHDGELFLIPRFEDYWGFFGGNVEEGEDLEKAALRNLRDLSGIKWLQVVKKLESRIGYFGDDGNKVDRHIFLIRSSVKSDIKLRDGILGYAWLPFREALDLLTYPGHKRALREARMFIRDGI